MNHIRRPAVGLDEVRIQRSIPSQATTILRPASQGGAGWRPDVPHIIIYAGDTPGHNIWPTSMNFAYADTWHYPRAYTADDWPADSWVQPVSTRASGSVHINAFKLVSSLQRADEFYTWTPSLPDWVFSGSGVVEVYGHSRFGHVGDPWLYDTSVQATGTATIEALAALDISVICLSGGHSELIPFSGVGSDFDKMTLNELNDIFTTPNTGVELGFQTVWQLEDDTTAELFGNENIALEGAALAHLTGAVNPSTGKNLGWCLDRYNGTLDGFLEPVATLAARITEDVIEHAGHLGNANRFDVAFLVDDSGSFGGSQSRATSAFLAVIDAFLAEDRDIFVGISRYSDYAKRTHDNGGFSERPFTLQYPLAPVSSEEERAAMIDALQTTIPGNGGGDTPETQWEGLYQLATGAGIDANHNGSTEDSGTAGSKGPTETPPAGYDLDTEGADTGLGWYWPGGSGDVPSFEGVGVDPRGGALALDRSVRVTTYGPVE